MSYICVKILRLVALRKIVHSYGNHLLNTAYTQCSDVKSYVHKMTSQGFPVVLGYKILC